MTPSPPGPAVVGNRADQRIDQGVDEARATLDQLSRADVDWAVLSGALEREGVEAFAKSFQDALSGIEMKLAEVSRR